MQHSGQILLTKTLTYLYLTRAQITPQNITIFNATDGKRAKERFIDASDDAVLLDMASTRLEIYDVSRMHSMVKVTLKGVVTFIVSKTYRIWGSTSQLRRFECFKTFFVRKWT